MIGYIRLQADDPWLTSLLLRFFYAHDYQANINNRHTDDQRQSLSVHARMYAMAHKYYVPLLKDLAQEKFDAASGSSHNASVGTSHVILA